jgi:hypothetical protein
MCAQMSNDEAEQARLWQAAERYKNALNSADPHE